MATARGRGYSIRVPGETQKLFQPLRRPGEESLKKHLNGPDGKKQDSDKISEISIKLDQLNTTNSRETDLLCLAESIKKLSQTGDLQQYVDVIFKFGLKNKWSAHVAAILCNHLGDTVVDGIKFRSLLFKKLQMNYAARNVNYTQLDKFLMDATFLCEIFHHLHLSDGSYCKFLTRPVLDYFTMLVDGGSEKEIEVFAEQIAKCYMNLKRCDSDGLETLHVKIRKQILCETSSVSIKAMLLEILELILTDWKPVSFNTRNFYDVMSKPIVRICE